MRQFILITSGSWRIPVSFRHVRGTRNIRQGTLNIQYPLRLPFFTGEYESKQASPDCRLTEFWIGRILRASPWAGRRQHDHDYADVLNKGGLGIRSPVDGL